MTEEAVVSWGEQRKKGKALWIVRNFGFTLLITAAIYAVAWFIAWKLDTIWIFFWPAYSIIQSFFTWSELEDRYAAYEVLVILDDSNAAE